MPAESQFVNGLRLNKNKTGGLKPPDLPLATYDHW
jgi:hypothetical protein